MKEVSDTHRLGKLTHIRYFDKLERMKYEAQGEYRPYLYRPEDVKDGTRHIYALN